MPREADVHTGADVARVRRALQAERDAALLYRRLAAKLHEPVWRVLVERLAAEEGSHAAHWAAWLVEAGEPIPEFRPSVRSRLLAWLAGIFGIRAVAPFLVRLEDGEATRYRTALHAPEMRAEERHHARVFAALAAGERDVAAVKTRTTSASFNLRAAIFGVNDGLVSNLSLTAGLAGAQTAAAFIVLAGTAGLLAGAFMAGGEYISVRSQRELLERELELKRIDSEDSPEKAAGPLTGLQAGLDALGSPLAAALSSFTAFGFGALLPLVPYIVAPPAESLTLSIAATALALFGVGALLATLSDRNPAQGGARMLAIGGSAATVTYAIGRLLGASSLGG